MHARQKPLWASPLPAIRRPGRRWSVTGREVLALVELGPVPSGRGRLRRSGPPRPGTDRPAGHGKADAGGEGTAGYLSATCGLDVAHANIEISHRKRPRTPAWEGEGRPARVQPPLLKNERQQSRRFRVGCLWIVVQELGRPAAVAQPGIAPKNVRLCSRLAFDPGLLDKRENKAGQVCAGWWEPSGTGQQIALLSLVVS